MFHFPTYGCPPRRIVPSLHGVQRLFSIFPQGGPGVGLVLLRLTLVCGLLACVRAGTGHISGAPLQLLWNLAALCLLAGLFTPWFAAVCCLGAIVGAWRHGLGMAALLHLLFALCAAAVVLLGPGAYSIDARLFGRRIVRAPSSRD